MICYNDNNNNASMFVKSKLNPSKNNYHNNENQLNQSIKPQDIESIDNGSSDFSTVYRRESNYTSAT